MANLQEQINQLQLRVSELELKIMILESKIPQYRDYQIPQQHYYTIFNPKEITC